MKPEAGKDYQVTHSRKGQFTMHVDSVNGEWASGTIISGHARYISEDNRHAGEEITVRIELAKFKPV